MFEGNWKCSTCGGAITQLPFQPRSESGLTCRTCYAKSKAPASTTPATAVAPEMSTPSEPAPLDDMPNYDDLESASEPMSVEDSFAGLEVSEAAGSGDKPKFAGDWTCAGCGNAITSLPFAPRTTNNLKCLDCFKASR